MADGSIVDLVVDLKKKPLPPEMINDAIRKAAASGPMKGIIQYSEEPLVSSDVIRNPYSSIFDSLLTNVEGDLVEVFSWYDNEWGYSKRLVDLMQYMSKKWR